MLGATWGQFDLEQGVWIKPSAHTKQKRSHRVPLSGPAVELLRKMQLNASGEFLFPGRLPGKPLTEIKKFWDSVCRQADLKDLRIHDLRHTYASVLASSGISLPIIGGLLGHTQPGTTAQYAHLFDDPLRDATNIVGRTVLQETPNETEPPPSHSP